MLPDLLAPEFSEDDEDDVLSVIDVDEGDWAHELGLSSIGLAPMSTSGVHDPGHLQIPEGRGLADSGTTSMDIASSTIDSAPTPFLFQIPDGLLSDDFSHTTPRATRCQGFVLGRGVGSKHQGKRGGNPQPGTARRGGDAGRLDELSSSFAKDVLTKCSEKGTGRYPFGKCWKQSTCRMDLFQRFEMDYSTLYKAVTELRNETYSMSCPARVDALTDVLILVYRNQKLNRGKVGAVVFQERVCIFCYVWAHGYSSSAFKNARKRARQTVVCGEPLSKSVDGRIFQRHDATGKEIILAWCLKELRSYGGESPQHAETVYFGSISIEHDLYPIFYDECYGTHQSITAMNDPPQVVDVKSWKEHCKGSKPDLPAGYFGKVVREAFGPKWELYKSPFHGRFHDCPVTGRCRICNECAEGQINTKLTKAQRHDFKDKYDKHLFQQFRERVHYRVRILLSSESFRTLYNGGPSDRPNNWLSFG